MRIRELVIAGVVVLAGLTLWSSTASAARISDVRNTKHNFSQGVAPQAGTDGASRTVRATSEDEICVFCHTPHGANADTVAHGPLWNRELPASSLYTKYSSSSIDSTIQDPNGVSKLCLSCHDGTIAIGSVRNVRAQWQTTISMTGTATGGTMPLGAGETTGFTRRLGRDLTNDHPISLTYNSAFVNADTEMRAPGQDPIRVRGLNPRPGIQNIHLQPENMSNPTTNTGQVQCISCHDPHIRDTTQTGIKFLRFNKLQTVTPDGSNTFLPNSDIICLACHTKAGWETSAHAQRLVADETYTSAAAAAREFPSNTQVWQSACLACHDTHTVSGSRRLIREGVDGGTTTLSGYTIKRGNGQPAIEEACYACHGPSRGTLVGQGGGSFEVPDTQTDFNLAYHMPITNTDQAAGREMHDIGTSHPNTSNTGGGADFIEDPNLLGRNNLNNRHAECTDCHNPHRVTKRRLFNQDNQPNQTPDPEGTHNHTQPHNNLASGVLRGAWGVEPQYTSNSFHTDPGSFIVKRGLPGSGTAVTSTWVTREYQVCFKCHSNHGFPNGYNGPPTLGVSTPSGTNGMTRYTNIAREYNSPSTHAGEPRSVGTDGGASYNTNNHRSWHPVMQPTQRTAAARNADANLWLSPFRSPGSQTMYCTDCHGTNTSALGSVPDGGTNGNPWGPHGSTNIFLLKGPWSGDANGGTGELEGSPNAQSHLCFNCHDFNQYADPTNNAPLNSGFQLDPNLGGMGGGGMGGMGGGGGGCMGGGMMCMGAMTGAMNNLHIFHANQVTNFRCNLCHVAVPHGWKNKNFLVNLNDVGQEAGYSTPREVRGCGTGGDGQCGQRVVYPPYYNKAALKVVNFGASGLWDPAFCGSSGNNGGNGVTGVGWMAGSNEACNNLP